MTSQVKAAYISDAGSPDGSPRRLLLPDGSPARRGIYPPRRPQNGHFPDCPYPTRPRKSCPLCRSEELAPVEK